MSYSSIAVAAIVVAGLAIGVAVCAAVLLCMGRRRLAERMLPAFLAVLAGGILLSFAAVAGSEDDLQAQAERTVRYATTAERTELARAGHYTTSVTRLAHLSRGLSVELEVDGASGASDPRAGSGHHHLVGVAWRRHPRGGRARCGRHRRARDRAPRGTPAQPGADPRQTAYVLTGGRVPVR